MGDKSLLHKQRSRELKFEASVYPRKPEKKMNANTPASHREEAVQQGRLANEAFAKGFDRKAQKHIDRARELVLLALKLEQDEAISQSRG